MSKGQAWPKATAVGWPQCAVVAITRGAMRIPPQFEVVRTTAFRRESETEPGGAVSSATASTGRHSKSSLIAPDARASSHPIALASPPSKNATCSPATPSDQTTRRIAPSCSTRDQCPARRMVVSTTPPDLLRVHGADCVRDAHLDRTTPSENTSARRSSSRRALWSVTPTNPSILAPANAATDDFGAAAVVRAQPQRLVTRTLALARTSRAYSRHGPRLA